MDLATIIGLIVGNGLLLLVIRHDPSQYLDLEGVQIVLGGTLGAIMMTLPFRRCFEVFTITRQAFVSRLTHPREIIEKLVRCSEIARRDGILALEAIMGDIEDRFMVKGIQMAVDGSDPEAIQDALGIELEQSQKRHLAAKVIFDDIAKYAPAFGLVGTLMGLIGMLANLQDSSQIAPNMAIALTCTLYGAYVANAFALPIGEKLWSRNAEETTIKEMIIQGVMAIQSGDNPKIVEQKLKLFLPPRMRGER